MVAGFVECAECAPYDRRPAATGQGRGLSFVPNHISWLDIFAINVTTPAGFVAKSEVSSWPVLGWLVQRSGTLFIRRMVRSDTVRVNACMADLLRQGRALAVFAQGTSSTPEKAVQFHAPLLQSAVAANAQIQPVAVFTMTATVRVMMPQPLSMTPHSCSRSGELPVRPASRSPSHTCRQ